jgi:hypothetical protein
VVETTDAGKARSGLDELTRDGSGEYGYAISGRTVVLARTDSVAQAALDSARRGSLHDNDTFRRDLRMVGEGGVLTIWADLARAADTSTDSPTAGLRGRLVASLQFTDTAADLKIHAVGLPPSGLGAETVGPRLAALPDDTALTLGISGADKIVQRAYDGADKSTLGESVGALGERTGLVLPDDLAALVGSSTVVAVGGSDGGVDVGLISRTDDTDTARSAAQRLLNALGQDNNALAVRSVSDGTVLANSSSYADRLGPPGRLGDSQLFRDALPDLGSAQAALYVDVQRLSKLGGVTPPGPVDRFRSLGVTAAVSADTATIRLRLVVA